MFLGRLCGHELRAEIRARSILDTSQRTAMGKVQTSLLLLLRLSRNKKSAIYDRAWQAVEVTPRLYDVEASRNMKGTIVR